MKVLAHDFSRRPKRAIDASWRNANASRIDHKKAGFSTGSVRSTAQVSLRRARARSASWNDLTRLWHAQITIGTRDPE
jgi:hypothetical protein